MGVKYSAVLGMDCKDVEIEDPPLFKDVAAKTLPHFLTHPELQPILERGQWNWDGTDAEEFLADFFQFPLIHWQAACTVKANGGWCPFGVFQIDAEVQIIWGEYKRAFNRKHGRDPLEPKRLPVPIVKLEWELPT